MADNALIHVPPRITEDDFQVGRMKPLSSDLEDLSAAIIRHLVSSGEGDKTKIQLQGLEKFKTHGGWSFTDADNLKEFEKWFSIFDAVFFNGILRGYCQLTLFPRSRGTPWSFWDGIMEYRVLYLPGQGRDPRFRNGKIKIDIGIQRLADTYNKKSPTRKIREYRNTLLHEMLKAVFLLYACQCKNGCEEKYSKFMSHCGGFGMPVGVIP